MPMFDARGLLVALDTMKPASNFAQDINIHYAQAKVSYHGVLLPEQKLTQCALQEIERFRVSRFWLSVCLLLKVSSVNKCLNNCTNDGSHSS